MREPSHSDYIETPFVVKTSAQHEAILAAKKEANILAAATAAGITASTLSDFETILASSSFTATPSTAVIKSADSGSTSNWVLSEPWARNESGNGYNVGNYGGEFYLKNGSISQTVTVPHAGLYKLTLNALIRQGTATRCCNAGYKGSILSNAYVSINDTYYAQVPDWFTDRRADDSPGSTRRFKSMTDEDPTKYQMEVYAYIGDAKTATITLTVPGYVPEQWCIFNHWALTEYVPNVTISETANAAPAANPYANVTLTRTLQPGIWNTVSLPFDLSIAQVEQSDLNGSIIFGFKDSDASTINFERVNHMDAGKPYLVKLPETQTDNIVNPTFNGVSIIATEGDTEGDDGNVQFIGQIYNKSLTGISNVCYLSTNGYVKKMSATGSIKGLRSYFIVPDVNNVKMTFETPTGIEEINTNENTDIESAVYDLSGRRVTTPSKGFYIINGKKTFIK